MPRTHFDQQLADLQATVLALGAGATALLATVAEAIAVGDAGALRGMGARLGPLRAAAQAIDEQAFLLISLQQPVAGDLRRIAGARAVARELERVADHTADLARAGRRLLGLPALVLPAGGDAPLATAQSMLARALEAYADLDRALAATVWEMDYQIDEWYEDFYRGVVQEAARTPACLEAALAWLSFAHELERLGDRVTNICERVSYIVTGDLAYAHRPAERSAPDTDPAAADHPSTGPT